MSLTDLHIDVKTLKGVTADSRQVKEGYLFAALPGVNVDGADFIPAAIEAGATTILTKDEFDVPEGVQLIKSDNPHRAFAKIVSEFYGLQPETVVAVTGTNGKTSVVHFVRQLWSALGCKSASLGTLGVQSDDDDIEGNMTTPDPVTLHQELKELDEKGVTHLAMEASSHGLVQYRLDGVWVSAAGFTNISRDHLDYHADMEEYLAAKSRLFSEVMVGGTAVLNADIPEYETLKEAATAHAVLSYGLKGDDLKLVDVTPTAHGQQAKLSVLGQDYDVELPLVGQFQLMNALCALGLVLADSREKVDELVHALASLKAVSGRLQSVKGHPKGAGVYVDYAHTPDALEHVLKALRPHTSAKLVALIGCGGDRDKGKRPIMGQVAAELSDVVIITDDNPRSEDPAQIRGEVIQGAPGAQDIGGRREAIVAGIEMLESGDIFVIAGKGHEQGQTFKDHTEEFDDVTEAKKAIEGLK